MHVAIDGRLVHYSPAGISQYTTQLVSALSKLDQPERLTVLYSARGRPPTANGRVRGLAILTPPHHRLEQTFLPLEVLRARPDLLHSPDFIPPFWRRWRSVITVHDLGFLHFPETLTPDSRAYYGQINRAGQEADAII